MSTPEAPDPRQAGTFARAQRFRREHADELDRSQHRSALLLAGLLGIMAAGIALGAVVGRSWVGGLGALVAVASPWCWLRGDRHRVDEIAPEHRGSYARQFGWSLLAILALATGFALLIVGVQ